METMDSGRGPVQRARNAIGQTRASARQALGHAPEIVRRARQGAEQVADRVPGTVEQANTGARQAVTGLQTMTDSRLRLLAAASIGLGAGLRLAGASRIKTLAGLVPASILGFAIVSRPSKSHAEPRPIHP